MKTTVVMRAHNDMPIVNATLAMLARQDVPLSLLVFDNASTDGTREAAVAFGATVVDVAAGAYVPGRVLNAAMQYSEGEFVVFLNSDCTPANSSWLRCLLAGFTDDRVAAVFGRQLPRPDCSALFARDTEDTFGDGAHQARWRHCFSMASSAVRRSVWEQHPFDETLQYSEDIEWSWRLRRLGFGVRYVPAAMAVHSHNYTLSQLYRRHCGEGRAEAHIFTWSAWQRSWVRYAILPWGRQVWRDLMWCVGTGQPATALQAPLVRLVQMAGRWNGFRTGLAELTRPPVPSAGGVGLSIGGTR